MKKLPIYYSVLLLLFGISSAYSQTNANSEITIGAYYFDGWKASSRLITNSLKTQYAQREPVWGWVTSTQSIVDKQINLAAASGIDFFSFCWFYQPKKDIHKLNQALFFYHNSPYKNKLKFSLMVANHSGFVIGPKDWDVVCYDFIQQFKDKNYIKIDGKPLISFFSVYTLIKSFGSPQKVKEALDELRSKARKEGLPGVNIALCAYLKPWMLKAAKECGFDILTGYNYHDGGYEDLLSKSKVKGQKTYMSRKQPIDSMQKAEIDIWNKFLSKTTIPYIPVVTLNWDKRPMANRTNNLARTPYYTGYSEESVYKSIKQGIEWVKQKGNLIPGKILMVYAWNENVEGAYLTPSKNGDKFLNGLKKAVKETN